MRKEDHIITKIFTRISNELEAIGAVSKYAFWQAASHFFKTSKESEIRTDLDFTCHRSIREETRAEEMLNEKTAQLDFDKTPLEREFTKHGAETVLSSHPADSSETVTNQKLIHEKSRDYGPSL